jgi:hypothetical protein
VIVTLGLDAEWEGDYVTWKGFDVSSRPSLNGLTQAGNKPFQRQKVTALMHRSEE